MSTPRLGLVQLGENERSSYVTYNELTRQLQAHKNVAVVSEILTAPPGTLLDGQCWYVAVGGTDAWVGQDKHFAQWYNGAWYFTLPAHGTQFYIESTQSRAYIDGSGDVVILTAPVTVYRDTIVAEAPHNYWELSGAGALAVDTMGDADGTLYSDVTQRVNPLIQEGRSYLFGGNFSRITFSTSLAASTTFSFECWIFRDFAPVSGGMILDLGGSVSLYLRPTNKLSLYYGSHHETTTSLLSGMTYHIGVDVNAGALTYYINGVADVSTYTGVPAVKATEIGARVGYGAGFYGRIDQAILRGTSEPASTYLTHYELGLPASPTYQDLILADLPVAYYPLNEYLTERANDIVGAYTGTPAGAVAPGAIGLVEGGTSYLFTDGRIDFTAHGPLASYSIELWLKFNVSPTSATHFALVTPVTSTSGGGLLVTAQRLNFVFSSLNHLANSNLAQNVAYHGVLAVDAGAGTFYLNGAQDGTVAGCPSVHLDKIGQGYTDGEPFKGFIDQVAVYDYALTAQQVLDHYNRGIGA